MIVLDASAVLTLLQDEDGSSVVEQSLLERPVLGVANLAEVLGKAADRGLDVERQQDLIAGMGISFEPVSAVDAIVSAELRASDVAAGRPVLSLGDRLCLALGRRLGVPVLTADRAWEGRAGDVELRWVR